MLNSRELKVPPSSEKLPDHPRLHDDVQGCIVGHYPLKLFKCIRTSKVTAITFLDVTTSVFLVRNDLIATDALTGI